jgi:glyoxylase-like metal-dependent hydrolase (beta-lactamase superfamily II)/rhodanese-related sulfurtransferase
MRFEQLNESSCKTYLVAEGDAAMLVDPLLGHEDRYLALLAEAGLRLRVVLDTHVHADHLSGCAALRDRTGADHAVHASSQAEAASRRVDEGDHLALGDLSIDFLHTPGHTGDSLTVRLPDRLLTGDFLFLGEGGAGRTDLPGGDPGAHWDALQKLTPLPDELLVFPGHDYRGGTSGTLGEQRRSNPRLQPTSRADYVAMLQSLKLPAADWMKDVVLANRRCTRDAGAVDIPAGGATCEVGAGCATVPTLTCAELLALAEVPVLVDVRNPDEWRGPFGHIEGALLLPLPQLAARLDELAHLRQRPLVTVCQMGGRSAQAAQILQDAGFTQVRSLAGGMGAWHILKLPVGR